MSNKECEESFLLFFSQNYTNQTTPNIPTNQTFPVALTSTNNGLESSFQPSLLPPTKKVAIKKKKEKEKYLSFSQSVPDGNLLLFLQKEEEDSFSTEEDKSFIEANDSGQGESGQGESAQGESGDLPQTDLILEISRPHYERFQSSTPSLPDSPLNSEFDLETDLLQESFSFDPSNNELPKKKSKSTNNDNNNNNGERNDDSLKGKMTPVRPNPLVANTSSHALNHASPSPSQFSSSIDKIFSTNFQDSNSSPFVLFDSTQSKSKKKRLHLKGKKRDLTNFKLDVKELTFEKKLDEGEFGIVHKATLWGIPVAVKTHKKINLNTFNSIRTEFLKEVNVLGSLRHPNIVLFIGYTTQPLSIVT